MYGILFKPCTQARVKCQFVYGLQCFGNVYFSLVFLDPFVKKKTSIIWRHVGHLGLVRSFMGTSSWSSSDTGVKMQLSQCQPCWTLHNCFELQVSLWHMRWSKIYWYKLGWCMSGLKISRVKLRIPKNEPIEARIGTSMDFPNSFAAWRWSSWCSFSIKYGMNVAQFTITLN